MGKRKKVRITADQGNLLFGVASGFNLPAELGDGDHQRKYNIAERGLAAKFVGALYAELAGRSDLYQSEKIIIFGPSGNLKKEKAGKDEVWTYVDREKEERILINKEIRQGAFWCILMALHPASPMLMPMHRQSDTAWPLADRLRLRPELEKEIGIDTAKSRSLELDEDGGEFEEEEKGGEEEEAAEDTASAKPEEAKA